MKYNPRGKTAFLLTAWEKKLLAMRRCGMKHREIAAGLGLSTISGIGQALSVASMKEQALANDHRAPEGHTRLGVARGQKRMKRA